MDTKNIASASDFRLTWLWRHAFVNPLPNITLAEQEFFRDRYLAMREKAAVLVSQISGAIPGLTVHDITHLDALWETASLVSEGAINVSPAEAFIFGASVLLHDSAMSIAAYPGGLEQLKQTVAWKDTVTALFGETPHTPEEIEEPPRDIAEKAIPAILRQLHAQQAGVLARQGWLSGSGDTLYLVDDPELRFFYGETIGKIANSHWWSVAKVEQDLLEDLGAFPGRTKSRIDRIKLACLLRVADALHLDQQRAPRFLRALTQPQGFSKLHWTFQERLASPHIEHEAVIFTAASPFDKSEADAWWLAYDTLVAIDKELQDVDLLLQNHGRSLFRARRVKGVGSPESLSRTIRTEGWRPVDTQLRVTDIPKVIETLGGAKLYGDDPKIVLRELIQNSADAIQARRRFQKRSEGWGTVLVEIVEREGFHWLTVEDNGIGMSERVLTGPLIDFGTSFWRSALATQEFPGLVASGMNAIGRYGIGFFSVFILGDVVRVLSRRCDQGEDTARVLEFRGGTGSRPILSPVSRGEAPIDGGTRVEIRLKDSPYEKGGLLVIAGEKAISLKKLVAAIAPSVEVSIETKEKDISSSAISSGDWVTLSESELISRLQPKPDEDAKDDYKPGHHSAMRTLFAEDGSPLGRAYIRPSEFSYSSGNGWVTIGGLRSSRIANIQGLLAGNTLTVSRDSAKPMISPAQFAQWASEQARIIFNSKADEEIKAKSAEIILECGGELNSLPIACLGDKTWMNSAELALFLGTQNELVISFEGEFSYDEYDDEVHPREFREEFEIDPTILVVPRYDGEILKFGTQSWPLGTTAKSYGTAKNLEVEVRKILRETWEQVFELEEIRQVGFVGEVGISRAIATFRNYDAGD